MRYIIVKESENARSGKDSEQGKRAGLTPKGGNAMSATEVIALAMLILTAVSLGYQLKK